MKIDKITIKELMAVKGGFVEQQDDCKTKECKKKTTKLKNRIKPITTNIDSTILLPLRLNADSTVVSCRSSSCKSAKYKCTTKVSKG